MTSGLALQTKLHRGFLCFFTMQKPLCESFRFLSPCQIMNLIYFMKGWINDENNGMHRQFLSHQGLPSGR
jgi:hypothetical protein